MAPIIDLLFVLSAALTIIKIAIELGDRLKDWWDNRRENEEEEELNAGVVFG